MKLTRAIALLFTLFICSVNIQAQTNEVRISKLSLNKKEKKVFNDRDSSITLIIDTLIMKDKSSLQFYGKKDVKIIVNHAEIGKQAFISGVGSKNNGSNFDIDANFQKLGSLYVVARGQDANNGMRTDPNGDAGNINIVYNANAIVPQQTDKKANNYLHTDVTPGGTRVIPNSELRNIYDRVKTAPAGLRGLPQGQIYSGSMGLEGKVSITAK